MFPTSLGGFRVVDHDHLRLRRRQLRRRQLRRRQPDAVVVPVEENTATLVARRFERLHPLAHSRVGPEAAQEAQRAIARVGLVVLTHDRLDRLGRLVGVVEGDGRDVMVQDVRLNDAVEEMAPDEAEFAVDGRRGSSKEVP